ncbi:MAG: DUF2834 domain-containing protein [Candidatus Promineifilaceae bacterium]
MRKTIYLIWAILGTVIPFMGFGNFIVANGLDLIGFANGAVANGAAAGFTADLFISSFVFWMFMFKDASERGIKNLWIYVACNLLVGLSLALPLYLYVREDTVNQ